MGRCLVIVQRLSAFPKIKNRKVILMKIFHDNVKRLTERVGLFCCNKVFKQILTKKVFWAIIYIGLE